MNMKAELAPQQTREKRKDISQHLFIILVVGLIVLVVC